MKDAEITNRAKDMHIQRQNEEREMFFERLNEASHQIGVLETKLLQLEGPRQDQADQDDSEIGAEVGHPDVPESDEHKQEEAN